MHPSDVVAIAVEALSRDSRCLPVFGDVVAATADAPAHSALRRVSGL
ncbi:hypothetical protein ACU686_03715 [Yinghuangia aomiensis]